jgi:quinol monooxygenase YgiN
MLISLITINPGAGKRQAVLEILHSMKGPTLAEHGCNACCIFEEHGDEPTVSYLELWNSPEEMARHIRSPLYNRVLEAMELSASPPEIGFHSVAETQGIELIERLRTRPGE